MVDVPRSRNGAAQIGAALALLASLAYADATVSLPGRN